MPWLEPADGPACHAWAEIEYLCGIVYARLIANGVVNNKGEARRLLTDYRQLRQTQMLYSDALGMNPASRIAIKADATSAAIDLAAAMAAPADSGDDRTEPAGENSDLAQALAISPESAETPDSDSRANAGDSDDGTRAGSAGVREIEVEVTAPGDDDDDDPAGRADIAALLYESRSSRNGRGRGA